MVKLAQISETHCTIWPMFHLERVLLGWLWLNNTWKFFQLEFLYRTVKDGRIKRSICPGKKTHSGKQSRWTLFRRRIFLTFLTPFRVRISYDASKTKSRNNPKKQVQKQVTKWAKSFFMIDLNVRFNFESTVVFDTSKKIQYADSSASALPRYSAKTTPERGKYIRLIIVPRPLSNNEKPRYSLKKCSND